MADLLTPGSGQNVAVSAMRRNKQAAATGEIDTGELTSNGGLRVPAGTNVPTIPEPAVSRIPSITSPAPKPAADIFATLGPSTSPFSGLEGTGGPLPSGVKSNAELLSLRDRQMPSYFTQAAEKAPVAPNIQKVTLGLPDVKPPTNGAVSEFVNPEPAPVVAPPTDIELANAKKGLSVDMQRGAVNVEPATMRRTTVDPLVGRPVDGWGANAVNVNAGNTNLRASLRGMAPNQAYQVSNGGIEDAGNRIYATKDANGRLSLTGTGDGEANKRYEASDQYKEGVANAKRMEAKLAQITEGRKEQDLRDAVMNSSIGQTKANRQNLKDYMEQKTLDKTLGKDREVAGMRLQAEKFFKDREFNQKQDEMDFNQRKEAEKSLQDQLNARFTTKDADGKIVPDAQRVGAHMAALTAQLGQTMEGLAKIAPNDPRYQQAQAQLAQLKRKGIAAIDSSDIERSTAELEAKDRIQQEHSIWNPFKGTMIDSNTPGAYDIVGRDRGLIQDQFVTRNGSKIPVNSLRYQEGIANALAPDLKTKTDRFNSIIPEGLRK